MSNTRQTALDELKGRIETLGNEWSRCTDSAAEHRGYARGYDAQARKIAELREQYIALVRAQYGADTPIPDLKKPTQ